MKILVAEDEQNIAESYKLILEFKGHEVTLTNDGQRCLDVYKTSLLPVSSLPKSTFDLVILDYRMPKKDGIQVAKEILTVVPTQRVLLATAYVQDISVSRLQEMPTTKSVELIQKPFDFDTFLHLVASHGGGNIFLPGSEISYPANGNVPNQNSIPIEKKSPSRSASASN